MTTSEQGPETAPTDRQKTLFIGNWFSTCGNCEQNADYEEEAHNNTYSDQPGCGVTWLFVSSDEVGREGVEPMRPDLVWRDPQEDDVGVSFATEAVALSDKKLLGTFLPGQIIDLE